MVCDINQSTRSYDGINQSTKNYWKILELIKKINERKPKQIYKPFTIKNLM